MRQPIAAMTQTTDAEVIPCTILPLLNMMPAPKNPIPVTICPTTLELSVASPISEVDKATKQYAPKQIKILVLIPAGLPKN